MQPIIYDVAVSIDGFISGVDGDISQFASEGAIVDDYYARLTGYSVAIMGRNTYEFGYRYGLEPGANPYRHMKTIVFSSEIKLPENRDVSVVRTLERPFLEDMKMSAEGPIYLCGGGQFAGVLLDAGLIDVLRLKRAPILLGQGVPLFRTASRCPVLVNTMTRPYDNGSVFQEFEFRR